MNHIPPYADATHAARREPVRSTATIQLRSGMCVDLLAPCLVELRLTDLATHLARLPRFLGATAGDRAYTVAQHSVLVMHLVMRQTANLFVHRAALLHDAHEALMGDIATPVKQALGRERVAELERRLAVPLYARFGLMATLIDHPLIHAADRMALAVEKREMLARPAWPWGGELPDPGEAGIGIDRIWGESEAYAGFLAAAALVGLR